MTHPTGEWIKKTAYSNNLSADSLALLFNVTRVQVFRIFKADKPSPQHLYRLADYLKIDLAELFSVLPPRPAAKPDIHTKSSNYVRLLEDYHLKDQELAIAKEDISRLKASDAKKDMEIARLKQEVADLKGISGDLPGHKRDTNEKKSLRKPQ